MVNAVPGYRLKEIVVCVVSAYLLPLLVATSQVGTSFFFIPHSRPFKNNSDKPPSRTGAHSRMQISVRQSFLGRTAYYEERKPPMGSADNQNNQHGALKTGPIRQLSACINYFSRVPCEPTPTACLHASSFSCACHTQRLSCLALWPWPSILSPALPATWPPPFPPFSSGEFEPESDPFLPWPLFGASVCCWAAAEVRPAAPPRPPPAPCSEVQPRPS
mmetsp:Transcript_34031/g.75435  ORF Transcript_34031/g.75435 Transcript_34031/m.75435 type:complete len:218 (+) Transcript_34031:1153-1806(+)